jgi:anthranilate phosphoribosyltransferase
MIAAIRRSGIGYFHAPFHHPVFAQMQPLRQALKRRTIFNLLGPLVNPMRLEYQLVGVSEKRLVPLYAKVLSQLNRKAALVCYSQDGMDEISISAPTTAAWVTPGKIRPMVIQPNAYGLKKTPLKGLTVGSVEESAIRAKNILTGKERGAARNVIALNAAYGLWLCGKAGSIREGLVLAGSSIDSGKAWNALQQLKAGSR